MPLTVKDLFKSFGSQQVLSGINLEVEQGQAVALLGSNGSGKSTLLRSIPRLIFPDSGSINIFGQDVVAAHSNELRSIRSQVGFIFQKHNLVPRLSALTNALHGALGSASFSRAWFQSLAPNSLRERAFCALNKVGLAEHAIKQVRYLSGGQSQRVAIARALMQEPKIILADEPVASLDPEAGENIMELLRSLSQVNGITLLFSTHNLEHALKYSDRIVGLAQGQIQFNRPSSELNPEVLRPFYDS